MEPIKCNECGEMLFYTGGCTGEFEHSNGTRECDEVITEEDN